MKVPIDGTENHHVMRESRMNFPGMIRLLREGTHNVAPALQGINMSVIEPSKLSS